MNIELLDRRRLKITLLRRDMSFYNIDYASFSYDDEQSRSIIKTLLRRAEKQTGFTYKECRLIIEMFPTAESGCVLYFTRMRNKPRGCGCGRVLTLTSGAHTAIYRFESARDLLFCAERLQCLPRRYADLLYSYENRFYLAVTTGFSNSASIHMFVSEFARVADRRILPVLQERGRFITADALAKIKQAAGKGGLMDNS